MKQKLLFFFILILSISIQSQELKFDQLLQLGGAIDDEGYMVEADQLGNIYTVGYFEDTVDFDPSSTLNNQVSNGLEDIFIQKMDPNGNLLWVKTYGGSGQDIGRDLTFDTNGDVLVTGYFSDTVNFDSSSVINNLIATQASDVFILKLRKNGDFVWVKSIGNDSLALGGSIDCDINGNILVTGAFGGTVDFDPDTSVNNLISNGDADIFVLKLDSNGSFIWANSIGSTDLDAGSLIKSDDDLNIYVIGNFQGNVDFDPGAGTSFLPNFNGFNAFILKLDANGNLLWVDGIVGPGFEVGLSIAIDNEGSVYSTGIFSGTVDFDIGPGTFNLSVPGPGGIFIKKTDSSGNFVWAKSMFTGQGYSIALDSNNNVYTAGIFTGTVNFNTDSASTFNIISNGSRDIFIQKLDVDGNFQWANSFGGAGFEGIRSIHIDKYESIYATGYFESTVDFDPDSINVQNFTSNGNKDIYILKLFQCENSSDSIALSSCRTYLSPSGKLWTQSGLYFDTIPNISGCDSLITINLTVIDIDTTTTVINNLNLFANDTLTSYQWLDCNNGNSPIVGDTNRSFVATANGSYAVELSKQGCVDTSSCIQVLTVGLDGVSEPQSSITLYPNPNNGSFNVSVSANDLDKSYQIIDIRGRLVQEAQFTQQSSQIDLGDFGKGIYFMRVIETGWSQKIVVMD